ncbi:MAG: hypothetical protein ACLQU3_01135 [Limisphaerales bacterium]
MRMSCFRRTLSTPVRWAGKVKRMQGGKPGGTYSAPGASSNLRGGQVSVLTIDTNPPPAFTRYATNLLNAERGGRNAE